MTPCPRCHWGIAERAPCLLCGWGIELDGAQREKEQRAAAGLPVVVDLVDVPVDAPPS